LANDPVTGGLIGIHRAQRQVIVAGRKGAPVRLRVLCYNIHHAAGVDGKLDVPRIARVIQSVKPDLVALQEVDRNTTRTGKVDQAAELARLTKMHHVFGANIAFQGGQYGNDILSRFPITEHRNHLLPNVEAGEQRGVLAATVQISKDRSLRLLATHFDHRRPDAERLASAKFVNQLTAKYPGIPAIFAGDLNDVPASRTLQEIGRTWTRTNARIMPTIPVGQPARQIDYIFVRPKARWTLVETRVLAEAVASDHRAIFAIIELRKSPRSASRFRRLLFPDDADFVPRFGAHSVGPSFVEFFEFSGFLRHRPGEVVEFVAVFTHVVELPRGVVLGNEFIITLTHGAVAFMFPKECAWLGAVLGKHRQQGLAFHAFSG